MLSPSNKILRKVLLLVLSVTLLSETAPLIHAEEKAKDSEETSKKVIDFDGDLVEGMNKQPWDSLNQISDQNRHRKSHLYQKRQNFRHETRETLEEMRQVR